MIIITICFCKKLKNPHLIFKFSTLNVKTYFGALPGFLGLASSDGLSWALKSKKSSKVSFYI
jgi:hypothetical protein